MKICIQKIFDSGFKCFILGKARIVVDLILLLTCVYSMGALPVVMDDLGLDPDQIGKATLPQTHNEEEEEEEEDVYLSDASLSTGPNTPEPHSTSPITKVWTLDSSTTTTTTTTAMK